MTFKMSETKGKSREHRVLVEIFNEEGFRISTKCTLRKML